MKINIELKGRFKEVLKLPDPHVLEVEDGTNVWDLPYRLCNDTGCSEDTFFTKDRRLKPNAAVTKNGRYPLWERGLFQLQSGPPCSKSQHIIGAYLR